MLIDAEKLPTATGVKVVEIVQLPPAMTVLPHVLVWEKSAAFAPVMEMLMMSRGTVPAFERVTVCAALIAPDTVLGKTRLNGDNTARGIGASVPVPLSATVCGEPVASSATLMAAVRVPAVAGMKVIEIVQLFPAESRLPQVVVSANELAFAPVIEMPVMLIGALPLFVSAIDCAVLATPTVVAGNALGIPIVT